MKGVAASRWPGEAARARERLMAKLVALYRTPKDPAAFDQYYFSTHVPLAKKIPGLRKYDVSDGTTLSPEGPSNFHLVATLHFDSLDAIKAGLGSPEGQANSRRPRQLRRWRGRIGLLRHQRRIEQNDFLRILL